MMYVLSLIREQRVNVHVVSQSSWQYDASDQRQYDVSE
jgi:hypothetical protein